MGENLKMLKMLKMCENIKKAIEALENAIDCIPEEEYPNLSDSPEYELFSEIIDTLESIGN